MKKNIILITAIFFLVSFAPDVYPAETPLKKIVFMPQWLPQAQFAGYFVARDLGIYKKYGLDVTILNGGPGAPTVKALEEKKADFVTMPLPAAIEKRSAGARIVNVAQIICRSSLMFVTKKKNGINSPKDMNGKKIGYWRNDFIGIPMAFFKKYDIQAQFLPINYSVEMFLADGVDAITVMWYNEYHKIINSGINPEELNTFFFFEHDLNFPEDGIYVHEDTLNGDPELCRKFVAASIEGWRYAFDNEEQTLDIVIKYIKEAHMMANKANQRWMLNRMRDLINPKDANQPLGELVEKDYLKTVNVLIESGSIKTAPEYGIFYKSCVKNVSK